MSKMMDVDKFESYIKKFGLSEEDKKIIWGMLNERGLAKHDDEIVRVVIQYEMERVLSKFKNVGDDTIKNASQIISDFQKVQKDYLNKVVSGFKELGDTKKRELETTVKTIVEDTTNNFIREVSEAIAKESKKSFAKMTEAQMTRNYLAYGIASVLLAIIVGTAGYHFGKNDTAGIASEFSQIAKSPTGRQWVDIVKLNNLNDIKNYCQPGKQSYTVQGGKPVCYMPIWLSESASPSASLSAPTDAGDVADTVSGFMSGIPDWLLVLFGFFVATGLRKFLRGLSDIKIINWILDIDRK